MQWTMYIGLFFNWGRLSPRRRCRWSSTYQSRKGQKAQGILKRPIRRISRCDGARLTRLLQRWKEYNLTQQTRSLWSRHAINYIEVNKSNSKIKYNLHLTFACYRTPRRLPFSNFTFLRFNWMPNGRSKWSCLPLERLVEWSTDKHTIFHPEFKPREANDCVQQYDFSWLKFQFGRAVAVTGCISAAEFWERGARLIFCEVWRFHCRHGTEGWTDYFPSIERNRQFQLCKISEFRSYLYTRFRTWHKI